MGGAFEAASPGSPGVDPVADVVAVPKNPYREPVAGIAALTRAIERGDLGDVRAVNHSYGEPLDVSTWIGAHAAFTCGPGPNDDATGSGPCTPWTEDRTVAERAQRTEALRPWLRRLAADQVLWVNSAGNDGGKLCDGGGVLQQGDPLLDSVCPPLVRPASTNNAITLAGATWHAADGPNPVLTVGGYGTIAPDPNTAGKRILSQSLDRIRFSNDGATVSAAGWLVSTKVGGSYNVWGGTSQAAPQVAGLAAYLAAMPAHPSMAAIRDAIVGWSRSDTTGGVGPRVDDFASLLSLPGAARSLVDVNDSSPDGSRRLVPNPGGADVLDTTIDPSDPSAGTAPDGAVDLRDFRRFRDAWLEVCQLGSADPSCPDPAHIALDGPPDHPKRDLNLDGCTDFAVNGTDRHCAAGEDTYSRFDFNGDGRMTAADRVEVPLAADGSPAAGPSQATAMTDLEVLASQYDTPAPGQWTAGDLSSLMTSGDLTAQVGGLFATGASKVTVTATDASTHQALVSVDADPAAGEAVLTVPAGTAVELSADITRPAGAEHVDLPGTFTLGIGEDRTVSVCGLRLLADPANLRPDGTSTATLTATIDACATPTVSGVDVELSVDPVGPGQLTVDRSTITTDAGGRATATLTAGTERATTTITAQAEVDDGAGGTATLTGHVLVRVDQQYALDVIAQTGGGGNFASLGHGPGIDDAGDVAFTGTSAGSSGTPGVYRSDAAGPANRIDGSLLVDGETVAGQVDLVGSGDAFVLTEHDTFATDGPTGADVRRAVRIPDGGSPEVLATSRAILTGIPAEPYSRPGPPGGLHRRLGAARRAPGRLGGRRAAHRPHHLRARRGAGDRRGRHRPGRRGHQRHPGPRDRRHDGAARRRGDRNRRPWPARVHARDPGRHQRARRGRLPVGHAARVAARGRVRLGGARQRRGQRRRAGRRVCGRSGRRQRTGRLRELAERGLDDPGAHRRAGPDARVDLSARLDLIHRGGGAAGIVGDSIVVAFLGTPTAAHAPATDQPGLFTVQVAFPAPRGGAAVAPAPDAPTPVVQLGDRVLGGDPVEAIAIHDPIGAAGTSTSDHELTWWQQAGSTQQVIRATWVGDGSTMATASHATPATADAPGGGFAVAGAQLDAPTSGPPGSRPTPPSAKRCSPLSSPPRSPVTRTPRSPSPTSPEREPGTGSPPSSTRATGTRRRPSTRGTPSTSSNRPAARRRAPPPTSAPTRSAPRCR